jgi:hypothetical protein
MTTTYNERSRRPRNAVEHERRLLDALGDDLDAAELHGAKP